MVPGPDEWSTKRLPEARRAYLEVAANFENIAQQIVATASAENICIDDYWSDNGLRENTFQIRFILSVDVITYDQFYNARDGLRARYWQSPDHGFSATRYLVDRLVGSLLASALPIAICGTVRNAENAELGHRMGRHRQSLEAESSKIWVSESEGDGVVTSSDVRLDVPRWRANENETGGKGALWRWTPIGRIIEIKGGLVGLDGTEQIPEGKRDRSCQIHRYGFS